jgi:CheY-like chemotaxis protein
MSILIVEDDLINGTIVERMLQSARYKTVRCDSGAEALKLLRDRSDIDLVVADIMMPEVTGLDLLRVIKDSSILKDLPVIFCSASMDVGKVRLAAALGCSTYLLKPVKRDLLLDKVSIALTKGKASLAHSSVVQKKLGIDSATYRELERSVAALLKSEIELLDFRLKNPSEPAPASQFKAIAESAASLGAEQLESKIRELLKCNHPGDFRLECMRVLREMHRVLSMLEPQIAAEAPISPQPLA